ncbi:Ubiquitin carboxyl-terminal hydrolase isozyme L5 [Leucoagaricus sp. SymC.cos]|nr:Ubiquitin carboxyl-terminal hydrolase isozyme L5 [Leucoagaricus sp. SymC.cos]
MNESPEIFEPIDLIGGPFAVIESDPGVFSSLTRGLGVKRVEVVELYDIEPWAVDHLRPSGLIFCFTWHKDAHRPTDFSDPASERVWFANQLSDDACATHAILNVLFNCPELDIGNELRDFREETREFSPVIRGLAITNSPLLRRVHNSLARPADIRASLNAAAIETTDSKKKESQNPRNKGKPGRPPKSRKANSGSPKKQAQTEEVDNPTYHFIGYVPAFGKVWELDGLKSGPLEVGELGSGTSSGDWMEVVRPALRLKMAKYGGSGLEDSNIRFSLLAIVEDTKSKLSDELEFLKKDKLRLESLMAPGWKETVDPMLLQRAQTMFERDLSEGYEHPPGFAGKRMQRDTELMQMSPEDLVSTWQNVVQDGMRTTSALEDELTRRSQIQVEHLKRTFDYEPFVKGFITELHNHGLLNPLLNLDENGRKIRQMKKQRL